MFNVQSFTATAPEWKEASGTALSFFLRALNIKASKFFFLLVPGDIDAFFELPRLSPAVYPLLPSPQLPSITRHSSFTTSSPAYSPSSFDPDDIPATNQTPRTSACVFLFPFPLTLTSRSYRKTPTELVAPDDMSLREKNADNCLVERANDASLRLTRAYAAAGSPAGVGDLDVGARSSLSSPTRSRRKALLVASKDVVDASGPLPLYMTMRIAGQRVLVAKGEAEEKKKRDELKANPAWQTLERRHARGTYSPHLFAGDVGDRASEGVPRLPNAKNAHSFALVDQF
ncbi:hypothetical protein B0H14DRAFT_3767858 [Mycena olivaceomarginata]|nr:hypothetical protein B0H14DRAFT_3767858 [Mycena olivaceomarginata]